MLRFLAGSKNAIRCEQDLTARVLASVVVARAVECFAKSDSPVVKGGGISPVSGSEYSYEKITYVLVLNVSHAKHSEGFRSDLYPFLCGH